MGVPVLSMGYTVFSGLGVVRPGRIANVAFASGPKLRSLSPLRLNWAPR